MILVQHLIIVLSSHLSTAIVPLGSNLIQNTNRQFSSALQERNLEAQAMTVALLQQLKYRVLAQQYQVADNKFGNSQTNGLLTRLLTLYT